MQVEVTDIRPEVTGAAQADLSVHVGPVHVDLPAVGMHDLADLGDGRLEHAVGRGVGDHQRSQVVLVLLGLRAQVGEIHIAVAIAGHRHDAHPGHHGRSRVGPVGARGDQAHVAVGVPA